MLAQRRVRRLALKADDDSSLQLAMPLLEDALRTASFPGLPQHGVVFIRKLALGAIQHKHNAVGYASRIDQLLLSIRPLVISPGLEEPAGAGGADAAAAHRQPLRFSLQINMFGG